MNPTLFAIQNASGEVLVALLNTLIPACLLALAIWTLFRLFPNLSAAVRYGAWWTVLIAVVAMPFTPRVFNVPHRFISAPPTPQPVALSELPSLLDDRKPDTIDRASKSPTVLVMPPLTIESPRAASILPELPKPSLLDKLRSARVTLPPGSWILWIAAIWLAAGLWRLARIARSHTYLRHVLSNSEAASPEAQTRLAFWTSVGKLRNSARLLTSNESTGPIAFGLLQPTIVLPTSLLQDLNDEELDHVLLHELAHLARRDNWTNLLARIIGVVAGLHPIAAYALHQIEHNRELACDDWVVSTTGEPHSYAAALARVFELTHPTMSSVELATGMADHPSPSHLGTRIGYLLTQGRSFRTRVPGKVWAMQAVALAALVLLGAECPRWVAMAQAPDKLTFPVPSPISKYFIPYTEAKPGDIVIFRHPTDIAQIVVPSEARTSTPAPVPVSAPQAHTPDELLSQTNLIMDQVNHDFEGRNIAQLQLPGPQQQELLSQLNDQLARSASESDVLTADLPKLVEEITRELRDSNAPNAASQRMRQDVENIIQRLRELRTHPTADQTNGNLLDAQIGRTQAQLANPPEQQARAARDEAQLQESITAAQSRQELYRAETHLLRLQREFSRMLQERDGLLTTYKPQHPKVKEAEAKLTAVRAEMAASEERIARLSSDMRMIKGEAPSAAEKQATAAAKASAFLADQLDEEQKKAGSPNTDRIIDLQKKLLAARQAEILAWKSYAEQIRAQSGGSPNP